MNSREKGKRGEREWAGVLKTVFGLRARRGAQFSGSPDSPDVVGSWPGTHPEVKRVEDLDVFAAVEQAVRDSGGKLPYVAHRVNGKEWCVTVRLGDLVKWLETVVEHRLKKGITNAEL